MYIHTAVGVLASVEMADILDGFHPSIWRGQLYLAQNRCELASGRKWLKSGNGQWPVLRAIHTLQHTMRNSSMF